MNGVNIMEKPKLLLHSCCGPCSTSVLERLLDDYDITVFFYNPNITDPEEYEKRKASQINFLNSYGKSIDFMEGDYDVESFYKGVKGLENEPEGGRRCIKCFRLRLKETAKMAKMLGIKNFSTTLSVSPHKSYQDIKAIGTEYEEKDLNFLKEDFKKKDGFSRSIQLSKEYGLYRQSYCGCKFSKIK